MDKAVELWHERLGASVIENFILMLGYYEKYYHAGMLYDNYGCNRYRYCKY